MALPILGAFVGSWNGIQFYAKNFTIGGKLYIANEYNGGLVPRGKELVSDAGFVLASGFVVADFALYSISGGTGLGIPTDLATTPNGWAKIADPEGNFYFKKLDGVSNTNDLDGDGINDTTGLEIVQRSASFTTQAMDWIKANPIYTAGILIGLYLLYTSSQGGKKRKKILGLI